MSEGPIYNGFPLAGAVRIEDQIASLRKLASMMEAGEAELVSMLLVFKYYHVADNEDGYTLRMGLVRDIAQRSAPEEPADVAPEPEEPKRRRKK